MIVAEEAGETGGFYELFDPLAISETQPIFFTSRSTGTTNDPQHLVKRQAIGSLSSEGLVILEDGTTYFGDESRPGNGSPGGGLYKFVPEQPYSPATGLITDPAQSPFANGIVYGLRLGTRDNNTDFGQGSEIGKGIWMAIDPLQFTDATGNLLLRQAQLALGLTGYYRPEDMERDPLIVVQSRTRVCWANTGNLSNGAESGLEEAANYGEIVCVEDQPEPTAATGAILLVTRLLNGHPQLAMPDNVAFQPHSGRLVITEDGPVEVLNADGSLRELGGDDIWMCLPDGDDDDLLSDGCIRIASLRDTDSEPTGIIFDASGEQGFVNLQHRPTGQGALLMITGFALPK